MTSQLLHRPSKLALIITLMLPFLGGCTTTHAVDKTSYKTNTAYAQSGFSEAQLDSLLAPIALYPDTVLSHVLIASTYPLEVVEADRWASNNSRLKGDDAVNAVDNRDWDPSVKALVAFPDILKRMSQDLDWTQQLGDAFLAGEERVMDSVQKLRNQAYASGNLDKVEHVRVIREEKTIYIEPSVERVVYVPVYDTRVVYGDWWWADYPPHYWSYPSSYVFASGFYWGPRVYIGPRFYFSGVHWHQRRVVVVDHHHHHRFYDSRSVVRYSNARHWHHNPTHRRGVAYRDNPTRERYNSPRESYRDTQQYRANLRDNAENRGGRLEGRSINDERVSGRIAPNSAREQRQGRDEQALQRLDRRQAGQITTNGVSGPAAANERAANERAANERAAQSRAELLRERMNNRSGRDVGNLQNREQLRDERRSTDPRQIERSNEQRQQTGTRDWDKSRDVQRIDRDANPRTRELPSGERSNIRGADQSLPQQNRPERTMMQRIERAQSTERAVERPQVQQERREAPRVEQAQRQERFDRPERFERPDRAERPERPRGGEAESRGVRER